MPAGDNILLNLPTVPGGDISRFVQKFGTSGPKTQVIMIDTRGDTTAAEALVSNSNPLPIKVFDGNGNAITSDQRGLERPLSVQIMDASGNQVTSFGGSGGTASNYGSAFPSAGTAVGFKDSAGANMQPGNLNSAGDLRVQTTPKVPFTFRVRITSTQTNGTLVNPGAAWRLTSLNIESSPVSTTPDNASVLIGLNPTTTPTNSQCVYSTAALPIGVFRNLAVADMAEGGATDKLLITTGTIASDTIDIYGTGYLK